MIAQTAVGRVRYTASFNHVLKRANARADAEEAQKSSWRERAAEREALVIATLRRPAPPRGWTIKAIAKDTDVYEGGVTRILRRLEDEGRATRENGGGYPFVWKLTDG